MDLRALIEQSLEALSDIAIDADLSIAELTEIAKRAYVHRAKSRATRSNGTVNRSRIAAITGLTRPETSALLAESPAARNIQKPSRATRVMNAWRNDRNFRDSRRRPRTLPLRGEQGSFEQLVRLYGGDVPPRAILDHLTRLNLAVLLPARGTLPKRVQPKKPTAPHTDPSRAQLLQLLSRCLRETPSPSVQQTDISALDSAQLAMLKRVINERATVFLSGLRAASHSHPNPTNRLTVFVGFAANTEGANLQARKTRSRK